MVGMFLCIWGFVFAFFSRPFGHGTMDLTRWLQVSIGFSLIELLVYALVAWVQHKVFQKLSRWNIVLEVSMYLLFYVVYTIASYYYYRSPIIRGFYKFPVFFSKIIFNIILILTPIIAIARHYILRFVPAAEKEEEKVSQAPDEEVIIRGSNKLDFLKLKKSELVCVSNTQNYVEVFFLEGDELQSKLIRSTLKKIHHDIGFLIQIHRSHLINPEHFKSWKNSTTILLTQKELPVSKTYKNELLSL